MRLTEVTATRTINVEVLKKICAPFIKQVNAANNTLLYCHYMGDKFDKMKGFRTITSKSEQNTLLANKQVHELFNRAFVNKFGFPYVDGALAQSKPNATYGHDTYVLFPTTDRFIWSPIIKNLHEYLVDHNDVRNLTSDEVEHILLYYTNKNLSRALTSGHEIMIADPVIALTLNEYHSIKQELLK